jgi:hypothetical protein
MCYEQNKTVGNYAHFIVTNRKCLFLCGVPFFVRSEIDFCIIKLLQNTRHKYFKSIKIPFRSEIKSNKTKRFLAK